MAEDPRDFRLLGPVREIEVIARGRGVRIREALRRRHGGRVWRKLKGIALIEDHDGTTGEAEIHWFQSHGVGRVEWKVKRWLR